MRSTGHSVSGHHIQAAICADGRGSQHGGIAVEESAAVTLEGEQRPVPAQRRRLPLANILSFVVGLVGIAAIGASADRTIE